MAEEWQVSRMGATNPFGLANNFWLGDGRIVPADEAEDAELADEESSSVVLNWPRSSSCSPFSSSASSKTNGGSGGSIASFDLAKERCRSLMVTSGAQLLFLVMNSFQAYA